MSELIFKTENHGKKAKEWIHTKTCLKYNFEFLFLFAFRDTCTSCFIMGWQHDLWQTQQLFIQSLTKQYIFKTLFQILTKAMFKILQQILMWHTCIKLTTFWYLSFTVEDI